MKGHKYNLLGISPDAEYFIIKECDFARYSPKLKTDQVWWTKYQKWDGPNFDDGAFHGGCVYRRKIK